MYYIYTYIHIYYIYMYIHLCFIHVYIYIYIYMIYLYNNFTHSGNQTWQLETPYKKEVSMGTYDGIHGHAWPCLITGGYIFQMELLVVVEIAVYAAVPCEILWNCTFVCITPMYVLRSFMLNFGE